MRALKRKRVTVGVVGTTIPVSVEMADGEVIPTSHFALRMSDGAITIWDRPTWDPMRQQVRTITRAQIDEART